MINDILNKEILLNIEDKNYSMEFDNKAYGILEQKISKGIFQIYEAVTSGSLTLSDYIEIASCALLKHHSKSEINEIKAKLEKMPGLVMQNLPAICSTYISPLTPPEVMQKANETSSKKKS